MDEESFTSKNKLQFINGSLLVPDKFDLIYEIWERCNNLAHSWILCSISPSITQSLIYIDLASDVWKDLKEMYNGGDLLKVVALTNEISMFRQGNMSVDDFYNEMKILWEELENYWPPPVCKCRIQCSCEAVKEYRSYRDQDTVIRFLLNLNENFAMVISQILLMQPLPPINRVFSMVLQHERQLGGTGSGFHTLEDAQPQIDVNLVDGRKFTGRGRG